MVTLALAVIVKNAENTIGKLLDSLHNRGFDRICIVDTGSTDRTRELVAEHIRTRDGSLPSEVSAWVAAEPLGPTEGEVMAQVEDQFRRTWILGLYGWHDDFAAARNFSFQLAAAGKPQRALVNNDGLWIMYLDADDHLEYRGERGKDAAWSVKDVVERAARNPDVNVIGLPYLYHEGVTRQEVLRIYRWDEGAWRWVDPIHEFMMHKDKRRVITKVTDLWVVHNATFEMQERSWERNTRIITSLIERGGLEPEQEARLLYHQGVAMRASGNAAAADAMHQIVEHTLGDTTMWLYARRERIILHALYMRNESAAPDRDSALLKAAELAGGLALRLPHIRDGYDLAGWVQCLRRRFLEAAAAFDNAKRLGTLPFMSIEDTWLTDGVFPAACALAYASVGRVDEAFEELKKVSVPLRGHDAVHDLYYEADRTTMRLIALRRTMDFVDVLIWDTQPVEALEVLKRAPACVRDLPVIAEAKRRLQRKLVHLNGYEDYSRCYASIPEDTYHNTAGSRAVLNTERAFQLLEWGRAQEKDGPPLYILAIGSQDGIIEDELLSLNERFRVTLVDVAPQASAPMQALIDRYPGRVDRFVMRGIREEAWSGSRSNADRMAHYDWTDQEHAFDVVTIFEVIEHLPSDERAVLELLRRLKPTGTLFISTPVADRWVEPYLTDEKLGPPWYGHVRAHTATSLWNLLRANGLTGDIIEGRDGTMVFQGTRAPPEPDVRRRVEILVAGTPTPFDAVSPENGHLGGSEEAVVRLARALVAKGVEVTVYAPPKYRTGARIAVSGGVLWRTPEEFDAGAPRKGDAAVLVWRSPQLLTSLIERAEQVGDRVDYKRFLWLHDYQYGASSDDYANATKILTLSEHHRRCLAEDGAPPNLMTHFPNGIDLADFPWPDEDKRDLHKVIYASSPERGLERLIDMWPNVRKKVPKATLDIFYDWTLAKQMYPQRFERLEAKLAELKDAGVTYHGGVDQPTLHAAFRRASVWAYPNEGNVETFCITAVKAMASGCYPVCTNAGALPEIVEIGEIVEEGAWFVFEDRLIDVLAHPPHTDRRQLARKVALEYTWERSADILLSLMDDE